MKILFLCSSYFPNIGGVEKHVRELSSVLHKKNCDITIISQLTTSQKLHENKNYQSAYTTDNEANNSKEIDKSIQTIRKKVDNALVYYFDFGKQDFFRKFRIWKSLWQIKKIISSVDVIHCHDVFFWYLPFRFIYPNKKVFITFHGYEAYPIPLKAIVVRKISEVLTYGNICIGDFIKKWYSTKPTYVSYGAVEIKSQKSKVKYQKSAVFVGRLDEQTGILTYQKAVRFLSRKIKNFKFTVVGDGRYRRFIDKKFSVTGFKNDPIPYLLSHRYAFVSRYLSILEAFASKRLVFAVYDNPVKKDYLEMAPYSKYMVITDSPEILANKIEYFIKHPQEEGKLINSAYKWVKDQTWGNMASVYLDLWKNGDKRLPR